MDIAVWRREMRSRLIEARSNQSAEAQNDAGAAVEEFLEEIFDLLTPGIVSAYWPFNGEIDLRPFMERLRVAGWQTALPVVMGRRLALQFRQWTAESDLGVGPFKIPFPRSGEVLRPDVVITPLVGFDDENYRLGYGAGYFDITLRDMVPPPLTLGVGFELSRIDTIHPLETDIPMDIIVTEAGIQKR